MSKRSGARNGLISLNGTPEGVPLQSTEARTSPEVGADGSLASLPWPNGLPLELNYIAEVAGDEFRIVATRIDVKLVRDAA